MKTATTTLLLLGTIVALWPTSIELLAQESPTSSDVTVPAPVDPSSISGIDSTVRPPWSDEVLQQIARWPLQHGGRVKPFGTFAGFTMLKINGKRSLVVEEEKLGPMEWALDC
ncbi:MAG: hypothetical protein HRU16_04465, partial [Planctomycetes bacterium]|nr:hypothetical protein [Planctomycetota bacterium]